jgi:hypothetical protein
MCFGLVHQVRASGERKTVMAVTIIGTIKSGGAYEVNGKKGKQIMISFTVVDELGNGYACQMWPDDPQHEQLAEVIGLVRRRQVQCMVAGYSVRERVDQNGNTRLQANFVVTDVIIPGVIGAQAA